MFEDEAIREVEFYVGTHATTGQHRIYNSLVQRTSHTKQFAVDIYSFCSIVVLQKFSSCIHFFYQKYKINHRYHYLNFKVKIP